MANKNITFDPNAGVSYGANVTINTGATFEETFKVKNTDKTNFDFTGYSGSSAIYEFLQKTKLFYDPFPNSHFSISYDPGGLLDLESVIKNQFTINKSKLAYNNFVELIKFY